MNAADVSAAIRQACPPMPPMDAVLAAVVPGSNPCVGLAGPGGRTAVVPLRSGVSLPAWVGESTVIAIDVDQLAPLWRLAGFAEPSNWVDYGVVLRLSNRSEDVVTTALGEGLIEEDLAKAARTVIRAATARDGVLARAGVEIQSSIQLMLMGALLFRFPPCLGRELPIWLAHRRINDAGVPVDVALVHACRVMLDRLGGMVATGLTLSGFAASRIRQDGYVLQILAGNGVTVPDLKTETLEPLLDDPAIPAAIRTVLVARLMSQQAGSFSHFTAIANAVDRDGCLRRGYTFAGHRLGRWTSRTGRLHCMRKGRLSPADTWHALRAVADGNIPALLRLTGNCPAHAAVAVAGLVRSCFSAPPGYCWAVVDISSFEVGGLLWLSQQDDALARLYDGGGVYREGLRACGLNPPTTGPEAETLYGVAKVCFLGPMFGAGASAVEKFAAGCGVSFSAHGLDAKTVVAGFRSRWPGIVRFWRDLTNAAATAFEVAGPCVAGRVSFQRIGRDLVVLLPSGGRLIYPRATLVRNRMGTDVDVAYDVYQEGAVERDAAWGGKLCQNVTSAVCRAHFAEALTAVAAEVSPRLLHTHDEIAVLVPEQTAQASLDRVAGILSASPAWAPGWPLKAKGFITSRYGKEAL